MARLQAHLARVAIAGALAAALSAPRDAQADPTPAEKETARALLDEGDREVEKKHYEAALKAFLAADAIMNVPTTGIELAKTQVLLGQLVEARDSALRVTRLPKGAR